MPQGYRFQVSFDMGVAAARRHFGGELSSKSKPIDNQTMLKLTARYLVVAMPGSSEVRISQKILL